MANVSSSNGLKKYPKLRFPEFDEPYRKCQIGDIYVERGQRGAGDMELLSVTMNDGVMPRSEIEGRTIRAKIRATTKLFAKMIWCITLCGCGKGQMEFPTTME